MSACVWRPREAIVLDIGVVMSKSRRRVGVLRTNGVVSLEFDAWGLYLIVVEVV
jgi:hypothetical protein